MVNLEPSICDTYKHITYFSKPIPAIYRHNCLFYFILHEIKTQSDVMVFRRSRYSFAFYPLTLRTFFSGGVIKGTKVIAVNRGQRPDVENRHTQQRT